MTKYILGVDPGLDGAFALCSRDEVIVFDMPTRKRVVNHIHKRQLDLPAIANWFDIYGSTIREACIEEPSAAPGQGVTSMFNFGFNCGVAQMAVASAIIPITLVRPATWKGALGLSSDKNASRAMASKLCPNHAHLFSRVKDDGRAEAVLLAYYIAKFTT